MPVYVLTRFNLFLGRAPRVTACGGSLEGRAMQGFRPRGRRWRPSGPLRALPIPYRGTRCLELCVRIGLYLHTYFTTVMVPLYSCRRPLESINWIAYT
jgi:hypothetical protein